MIKIKRRRAILKVDFKNIEGRGGGWGFICRDWSALRLYAKGKNLASLLKKRLIIYCVSDVVAISVPIKEVKWRWEEM